MHLRLNSVTFNQNITIGQDTGTSWYVDDEEIEWIMGYDFGVRIATEDKVIAVPWSNVRYAVEEPLDI